MTSRRHNCLLWGRWAYMWVTWVKSSQRSARSLPIFWRTLSNIMQSFEAVFWPSSWTHRNICSSAGSKRVARPNKILYLRRIYPSERSKFKLPYKPTTTCNGPVSLRVLFFRQHLSKDAKSGLENMLEFQWCFGNRWWDPMRINST